MKILSFLFSGEMMAKCICDDDCDDDCFIIKKSIRTIRVFLVCYARGPDFRAGGKIVFLADLARLCLCIEYRTLQDIIL